MQIWNRLRLAISRHSDQSSRRSARRSLLPQVQQVLAMLKDDERERLDLELARAYEFGFCPHTGQRTEGELTPFESNRDEWK